MRAGRLAYSTDIESFARKAQVIFLAEDGAENLTDVVMRIARLAPKPPILTVVTPVAVGTATALEKSLKDAGLQATIVSQPMFFHRWLRGGGFQLAGPADSGVDFE